MPKYIIEGGLNFYEELYKSLDVEETNKKCTEDDNLCLITNKVLSENFVKLVCGHKFNYDAIFADLKTHKQKFNQMEGTTSKLSVDEIRCPYCRTKQKGLLPYYENLGLPKINGVNHINEPVKSDYIYHKCDYILENPLYDPSGNNPVDFNATNLGNCKFIKCLYSGSKLNTISNENYGDEKNYCWNHKKEMIKKYKKEIKDKEKTELKKLKEEAKQKMKDAAKTAKENAKKEKEKEKEKKKALTTTSNVEIENVVTNSGCVQLLKSGPNKGNHCGCKILLDNLCNRHLKIKNGLINK
jgi:hypothetical protein